MKIKFLVYTMVMSLLAPAMVFAGTVTGKVSFTGTAPAPQAINMNADPTCAKLHSEPVYTEEVVVNPNGTLKHVFVYVKEGLEGGTYPTPSEAIVMDQKGCHYDPHVFGIQVNQPLTIVNSDATLHNVHGMPKESREFNLGMPIQGMKLNRKFDKPEIMVKFKCDVHPWMSAYAGVLPHPFFSVTDEQGAFEIQDLPAGSYTIEAWHEKYGPQTQQVTVDESGTQTVDFSFAG
ncbi:MAG TPA: carboxypeptidase regulatory-like domain-containing protein [bacterium]|nr:carboxypeptidase regulatory-like domain-containing protein [bacterium]